MQIQVNTDESIQGSEALTKHTEEVVTRVLARRFADQLTRIEVHLSDVNAGRTSQNDKRCLIEARPAGRQPVAVTEMADTIEQAINGAAHKLERALDTLIGKKSVRKVLDQEA